MSPSSVKDYARRYYCLGHLSGIKVIRIRSMWQEFSDGEILLYLTLHTGIGATCASFDAPDASP